MPVYGCPVCVTVDQGVIVGPPPRSFAVHRAYAPARAVQGHAPGRACARRPRTCVRPASRLPLQEARSSPRARRSGRTRTLQSQPQAPVAMPHGAPPPVPRQGRAGQARPIAGPHLPTPFLHVLTTPLEPAKLLAHLHGRPTRRSRGRGGPRSTLPPFSIAGAPPDTRNDKNRTPGEPTPLPRPFPAKSGLLLAGFRPSSSLSAAWTILQALSSFQGSRCKKQGSSCNKVL
jgi:hypothetical protein